jgi:hypothetical protein
MGRLCQLCRYKHVVTLNIFLSAHGQPPQGKPVIVRFLAGQGARVPVESSVGGFQVAPEEGP